MRVAAVVGLILVCLGGSGCSLLGKKKPGAIAAPRGPGESTWPASSGATGADPPAERAGARILSGILAGQVVDAAHRKPPATAIQVVSAQDASGAKAAPIEVLADANGYFVIQGLTAGQPYELIARAKDGDRTLAGRVWVRPPDPKVLIRMSEDLATSTTPPVPPPPQVPGQRPLQPGGAPPGTGTQSSLPHDHDWAPGRGLTTDGRGPASTPDYPGRPGDLGTPLRAEPAVVPAPVPRPGTAALPPNITSIPPQVDRNPVPLPVTMPAETPEASPVPSPAPPNPGPSAATPVPSCLLLGDRLHNFALRDLNGNKWEFRQRTGKLVLLDFWYTGCGPCQQAIYHLKDWQKRYGPGLEVVGIAYETGNVTEQTRKVRNVAERKEINYRLLLGSGQGVPCPVRDQFRVFHYPTLILLREDGHVLKKYEGLEAKNLQDLEILIQHHLGVAQRN